MGVHRHPPEKLVIAQLDPPQSKVQLYNICSIKKGNMTLVTNMSFKSNLFVKWWRKLVENLGILSSLWAGRKLEKWTKVKTKPNGTQSFGQEMSYWWTHCTSNMRKQKMQVIHAPLTQTSRAGCSISLWGKDQLFRRSETGKGAPQNKLAQKGFSQQLNFRSHAIHLLKNEVFFSPPFTSHP